METLRLMTVEVEKGHVGRPKKILADKVIVDSPLSEVIYHEFSWKFRFTYENILIPM